MTVMEECSYCWVLAGHGLVGTRILKTTRENKEVVLKVKENSSLSSYT